MLHFQQKIDKGSMGDKSLSAALASSSIPPGASASEPPCCDTDSTSPVNSINSDTSLPSRRYFFPNPKHMEPASTSASSIGSIFSFRKSSVTNSSRQDPLDIQTSEETERRKRSVVSVTGAAAKKTMRKRFSAAKLALRKLSQGSPSPHVVHHRTGTQSNASASPVSVASPTQEFQHLISDSLCNKDEATISPVPGTAHQASPTSTSIKNSTSRFFRKSAAVVMRKISSSTPPQTFQLNPRVEELKKQPLGPSLSWDPEQIQRYS